MSLLAVLPRILATPYAKRRKPAVAGLKKLEKSVYDRYCSAFLGRLTLLLILVLALTLGLLLILLFLLVLLTGFLLVRCHSSLLWLGGHPGGLV